MLGEDTTEILCFLVGNKKKELPFLRGQFEFVADERGGFRWCGRGQGEKVLRGRFGLRDCSLRRLDTFAH
jgi:hypothetical protein